MSLSTSHTPPRSTLFPYTTLFRSDLPSEGNNKGVAIRDREMEKKVLELTRQMGIGAQFGGKYFCHDVRVIRIARHGASVPIRSEEHTSELQSRRDLVCRLLLEKKN